MIIILKKNCNKKISIGFIAINPTQYLKKKKKLKTLFFSPKPDTYLLFFLGDKTQYFKLNLI